MKHPRPALIEEPVAASANPGPSRAEPAAMVSYICCPATVGVAPFEK